MFRLSVRVFFVLIVLNVVALTSSLVVRCPKAFLRNGGYKPRGKGRVIRYNCNPGFRIFGEKTATCLRGVWEFQEQPPICVKPGCQALTPPANGKMISVRGFANSVRTFTCDVGYSLTGTSAIFCDGIMWNATTPRCEPIVSDARASCDFESDDMCGWKHDTNDHFDWTRHSGPTPSNNVGTGPSWDHTKGQGAEGYYMFIESSSPRMENDTARLVSPVYPSELSQDACFIFYYHMYGQTIGTLNVFVKPEGQQERPNIFTISGQQGNKWIRAIARIEPLDENFQVVIEGIRGSGYVGDSAIDDVTLTNGSDCDAMTTDTPSVTNIAFDADSSQSCRLRCFVPPPSTGDVATVESQSDGNETLALTACDCHAACVGNYTCCEDFQDYCISDNTYQMARTAAASSGMSPLALFSILATGSCVLLVVVVATVVSLVRRRRRSARRSNMADDSDVRFLTADEILDFNIAQPRDEDL